MKEDWLELLKNARGISEYIFAISIDIRGFTSYCMRVDSQNVATYISKLYQKILNDYFPIVRYSKPMGDGLFITIKYNEDNLVELSNRIVDRCIALVDDFPMLMDDESMITDALPDRIGIGLTRDSACCIITDEEEIIDYSGKTLNHASRLMDKARPCGLVCDLRQFDGILKTEIRELFEEDSICLRGISEKTPIKILYLSGKVLIDERDRTPINEPAWNEIKQNYKHKTIKAWGNTFVFPLQKIPDNPENILLYFIFRRYVEGKIIRKIRSRKTYTLESKELDYSLRGGEPILRLNAKDIKSRLLKNEIPDNSTINVIIRYTS